MSMGEIVFAASAALHLLLFIVWLLSPPSALPPSAPSPRLSRKRTPATKSGPLCGHAGCKGRRDPRCRGGNCTRHCASQIEGCGGRCLELDAQQHRAAQEQDALRTYLSSVAPLEKVDTE